jgi:hypothetical protein
MLFSLFSIQQGRPVWANGIFDQAESALMRRRWLNARRFKHTLACFSLSLSLVQYFPLSNHWAN